VIGHVKKKDLGCADQERALDARRIRRESAFEHRREQMPQCAQSPEHSRNHAAHERAIAFGEFAQRGLILKLFVERTFTMQYAFENIRGDAADGEAGNGRRHGVLEGSYLPAYTEFNRCVVKFVRPQKRYGANLAPDLRDRT